MTCRHSHFSSSEVRVCLVISECRQWLSGLTACARCGDAESITPATINIYDFAHSNSPCNFDHFEFEARVRIPL